MPTGKEPGRITAAEARSRLVRVKTSDAVAESILDMLFSGELKAGDRVDLDAISRELGVSRVPVREALVALERDGLVEIPYHRGVFVARFDAGTIREGFELYALLSALTSSRVARSGDPEVLAELERAVAAVDEATEYREFEECEREFRRIINVASAGPRLRATLRGFGGLVPVASRLSMARSVDIERRLVHQEYEAIRRGDADASAASAVEHIKLLGEYAVETLRSRGVIGDEPDDETGPDELLQALAVLDGKRGKGKRGKGGT
ncbi:GntR family transcriptional regulator [Saccharopolyspora oryzae]|uniref:GntR family transcriptional regulator n=1 Tax=Saccharopolyspora oryzae TaxID=2997343 RepID=A0ABT4UVG6_9PSEU|nr:GntR family transcriptional regulator [Saccharopolyspora oryzae]MDA3625548.1 GntR family transcriptional regulator [Saccharopolyspora oryzae]